MLLYVLCWGALYMEQKILLLMQILRHHSTRDTWRIIMFLAAIMVLTLARRVEAILIIALRGMLLLPIWLKIVDSEFGYTAD
ncbi:hypothetical protein H740_04845 [Campylobacter showae CC57C]|uniref:Uncharacterized protein n=1 Tax=Campylobacter showae CC57C TaxID=1073353 RepID=M3GZ87_9BACT|nr:hypothetical protein H740_04845 [Campylobacter showae CC57C]